MIRWSSVTPTETGWYAWRPNRYSEPIFLTVVKYYGLTTDGAPTLVVSRGLTVTTAIQTPANLGGEWIGPIEEQDEEGHVRYHGAAGVYDLTRIFGKGNEPSPVEFERMLKQIIGEYREHSIQPV